MLVFLASFLRFSLCVGTQPRGSHVFLDHLAAEDIGRVQAGFGGTPVGGGSLVLPLFGRGAVALLKIDPSTCWDGLHVAVRGRQKCRLMGFVRVFLFVPVP